MLKQEDLQATSLEALSHPDGVGGVARPLAIAPVGQGLQLMLPVGSHLRGGGELEEAKGVRELEGGG